MSAYTDTLEDLAQGGHIVIVDRGGGVAVVVTPDGKRRPIAHKTFMQLKTSGRIAMEPHKYPTTWRHQGQDRGRD